MQAKWQSAIGRCRKMWQSSLGRFSQIWLQTIYKHKLFFGSSFQEFVWCKLQKSKGNILSKYSSFSFLIIPNFENLFYENVWTLLLVWQQFLNQVFFGGRGAIQTGSKKLSPFNAKSHYHLLEPNIANLAIFPWFFLAIETLKINLIFNCFILNLSCWQVRKRLIGCTDTHTHTKLR